MLRETLGEREAIILARWREYERVRCAAIKGAMRDHVPSGNIRWHPPYSVIITWATFNKLGIRF